LFKRVVFTLVILFTFCGCSDALQATSDEVANPASRPVLNTVPKQPSSTTTTKPHKFNGPRDVIVEGHLTVDVMEIAAPPRLNELVRRFQQALGENPGWWLEHVKNSKPGEPLPYDSRLGLSEAEYNEFLALSKKMTVQKKSEASLTITTKADDVYVFDGGQMLPDFSGIEIDLTNDVVRTPFGILTERSEINASEDSALGAWVGTQWKLEKTDPNGITGMVANLAVGKLKQSGRCVIYYDVRKVSLDGKVRISHVLNYDMPPRE